MTKLEHPDVKKNAGLLIRQWKDMIRGGPGTRLKLIFNIFFKHLIQFFVVTLKLPTACLVVSCFSINTSLQHVIVVFNANITPTKKVDISTCNIAVS